MKKIIIAVIIILVVACAGFLAYSKINSTVSGHDGITGVITFEKLSKDPVGYGVEFAEGEVPFNIELKKGTLKLELLKNGNLIFEETFDSSNSTTANKFAFFFENKLPGLPKKCITKTRPELSRNNIFKINNDDPQKYEFNYFSKKKYNIINEERERVPHNKGS